MHGLILRFYLWGHLKSLVCSSPLLSVECLRKCIVACCETVRNRPVVFGHIQRPAPLYYFLEPVGIKWFGYKQRSVIKSRLEKFCTMMSDSGTKFCNNSSRKLSQTHLHIPGYSFVFNPQATGLNFACHLIILTLRLLISYIYGAPSKARNANVIYIWTYVWQR